ncbi:UNVERIFIED_CONTAM: hypothetical protein Cloal_3747 [Acetivibrio alkalicellulosi]
MEYLSKGKKVDFRNFLKGYREYNKKEDLC